MAEMEEAGLKVLIYKKGCIMITFAELVETVEHLSEDEIDELRNILRKKKEQELIKAVEEARKESSEGKTLVLSSPEEIKSYFDKMMNDDD